MTATTPDTNENDMNDTLVNWSLRALKVLAVTAAIIWSVILIWFGIYILIFLTTMGLPSCRSQCHPTGISSPSLILKTNCS